MRAAGASRRSTRPPWPAGKCIDAEPDDEGVRTLVGCGQNLPDQKIVIVDPETLTACPAGRIGEIWVRGPSMAQGYWQQPEATEATFQARLERHRRRPVPPHRRSGIPAGRRVVRHRPREGSDHRSRRELLSAGHRADGAAKPSAAAARLRRGLYGGSRRQRAIGGRSGNRTPQARRFEPRFSMPSAAPCRPNTNWPWTPSC